MPYQTQPPAQDRQVALQGAGREIALTGPAELPPGQSGFGGLSGADPGARWTKPLGFGDDPMGGAAPGPDVRGR